MPAARENWRVTHRHVILAHQKKAARLGFVTIRNSRPMPPR
jgi:hypothetical protein